MYIYIGIQLCVGLFVCVHVNVDVYVGVDMNNKTGYYYIKYKMDFIEDSCI